MIPRDEGSCARQLKHMGTHAGKVSTARERTDFPSRKSGADHPRSACGRISDWAGNSIRIQLGGKGSGSEISTRKSQLEHIVASVSVAVLQNGETEIRRFGRGGKGSRRARQRYRCRSLREAVAQAVEGLGELKVPAQKITRRRRGAPRGRRKGLAGVGHGPPRIRPRGLLQQLLRAKIPRCLTAVRICCAPPRSSRLGSVFALIFCVGEA